MLKALLYKKLFDQIFRENYNRLYLYAFHIIGDREESRDIVSEVFEGLWKNIAGLDSQRAKGYLTVSVRNRCVDHLRKSVLHHQYSEEYVYTVSKFYEQVSEQAEQEELINRMLAELPEYTRNILEMCYLKRMKYAQVAEILDISPNTVKKHIVKALKVLRERFGEKQDSGYPFSSTVRTE